MSHSKPPIIWLNVFIFLSSFLIACVFVPWFGLTQGFGAEHLIWLVISFSFCNLSITAGYHRLWSHKTYEAHWSIRLIFAIGGAFALQNSVLHWSSDHRIHHKHVDHIDKDPYAATRGFWFSHIGWMLRNYETNPIKEYSNCRDLKRDSIVIWQHKNYLWLALATNLGFPMLLGLIYDDILSMFLIVGAFRLVLSHHSTFFINSLAHIWGSQPYTDKNSARDNTLLSIFTFGEGYHNYHHIFENDYRNGIYWWQYDPTKWLIKTMSWLGLANKLKVTSKFKIEKAKAEQLLINTKKKVMQLPNSESIQNTLNTELEALIEKMREFYDVRREVLSIKAKDLNSKYERSILELKYRVVKKEFVVQKKNWRKLNLQYT
jgi:stearoyl-CoA desaturase (delta-9 desaturase)